MDQKNPLHTEEEPDVSGSLLSHDLRSALADVIGGLQLIDLTQLSGANKVQMERILVASEALVTMMDELSVTLQGLSQGRMERREAVNLHEFLEQVAKRWRGVAEQRGLEFSLTIKGPIPKFTTLSRGSLERILGNILDNAIKYTCHGSVKMHVSVQSCGWLAFHFQDSGNGFSPEALANLYKFGGRPDNSEQPGTGFGLSSVKAIIDRLNGRIDVQNTDQGASVLVSFPSSAWRPDQEPVDSGPKSLASGYLLTGLDFLLAEDNKTSQLVAFNMLERLGAKVTVVDNGVAALQALSQHKFDAVLLDIEMPEKSGLDVIREVRVQPGSMARIPLIALTAFVMEDHRAKIIAAGANGTIAKPVTNAEALGREINAILNGMGADHRDAHHSVKDPSHRRFLDAEIYFNLRNSVGDEAFFEILEKMEADLQDTRESLIGAIAKMDLQELRQASHVLISLAGAIGATRLLVWSQQINLLANNARTSEIQTKFDECISDLDRLILFVRDQWRMR